MPANTTLPLSKIRNSDCQSPRNLLLHSIINEDLGGVYMRILLTVILLAHISSAVRAEEATWVPISDTAEFAAALERIPLTDGDEDTTLALTARQLLPLMIKAFKHESTFELNAAQLATVGVRSGFQIKTGIDISYFNNRPGQDTGWTGIYIKESAIETMSLKDYRARYTAPHENWVLREIEGKDYDRVIRFFIRAHDHSGQWNNHLFAIPVTKAGSVHLFTNFSSFGNPDYKMRITHEQAEKMEEARTLRPGTEHSPKTVRDDIYTKIDRILDQP